jgi:hypothetical protein
MIIMKKHRNALGDLFYSDKKHEEEMAKYEALGSIANKSATTSPLLYAIPIIAIIGTLIIVAVVMKKKKS